MLRVCRHADAGTFVLTGWRKEGDRLSFQTESGAHGGPGDRETDAFALLPQDAPLPEASPLRPLHLREGALRFLGRHSYGRPTLKRPADGRFRLMTYNVHSCVGMDGRLSLERIARVIGHHAPDVLAMQELDVHCTRTGCVDQAQRIADKLEMHFHFYPSFHIEDGSFGNAVLSRFPMQVMRVGVLPRIAALKGEPRGAISVVIDVPGSPVQLVNTHLSIWPRERLMQVRALRREWLEGACAPLVLCGDLNAVPGSWSYRLLHRSMVDVQKQALASKPRRTWAGGSYPLFRIDHVFINDGLRVFAADVPATSLERAASDHLPLVVDLAVERGGRP
jgi:endonuclease/exonuclease/phosphatase family metal-dependent hydrolase